MFETPYEKMICDSDLGDGGICFYQNYFEWVNRDNGKSFKINYLDITDVKIIEGIKKTVIISTNDGKTTRLYLYKAGTLKQLLSAAVERLNNTSAEEQAEDDISKLERLAKLHESGALTDEEFVKAKQKILG